MINSKEEIGDINRAIKNETSLNGGNDYIEITQQLILKAKNLDDKLGEPSALLNLGSIMNHIGNYDSASNYFNRAISVGKVKKHTINF